MSVCCFHFDEKKSAFRAQILQITWQIYPPGPCESLAEGLWHQHVLSLAEPRHRWLSGEFLIQIWVWFVSNELPLFFVSMMPHVSTSHLQFEYTGGADVVQMRFLRLNSRFSSQNITYFCHPGSRQSQREREIKFLADTRRQSYVGVLQECEVTWSDCFIHLLISKTWWSVKKRHKFSLCRGLWT